MTGCNLRGGLIEYLPQAMSFLGGSFVGESGLKATRSADGAAPDAAPPHPRRWWAVALLSMRGWLGCSGCGRTGLLSAEQNLVWLTFGTIPGQAAEYYGVSQYWIENVFPALGGACAPGGRSVGGRIHIPADGCAHCLGDRPHHTLFR